LFSDSCVPKLSLLKCFRRANPRVMAAVKFGEPQWLAVIYGSYFCMTVWLQKLSCSEYRNYRAVVAKQAGNPVSHIQPKQAQAVTREPTPF
jgi:hypothetical protein